MDGDRTFKFEAPRATKPIPNGMYTGRIVCDQKSYREASVRGKKILYLDLTVNIDQMPGDTIVVGYSTGEVGKPPVVTSQLGKLMSYWVSVQPGMTLSPVDILNGKEIGFMVMNKPGEKDPTRFFPSVVKESVVPKGMTQPPAPMQPSAQYSQPQGQPAQGYPGQQPGNFPPAQPRA